MNSLLYCVSGILISLMTACTGSDQPSGELKASMERGARIYRAYCLTCHMANGKGVPNVYPPLADSDYMLEDQARAIRQVLYGAQGEMVVNGQVYNNIMPAQQLSNEQTADVLNYVYNSWGNKAELILPDDVEKQRKK